MSDEEDPTFDIPYSLPSNTHSIALSKRTPTQAYATQSAKYMPDFGGILEVPGSDSKNNGLGSGFPFHPKPHYIRIFGSNDSKPHQETNSVKCLAITSYLESISDRHFSAIRAINKDLYFNSIKKIDCNLETPKTYESVIYAHVPYNDRIVGIKYGINHEDLLLVKFDQGVKLLKLNKSYQLPQRDDTCGTGLEVLEETAIDFAGSFSERQGFQVKDACLGYYNKSMFGMASNGVDQNHIKIYDLESNPRQAFQTIAWSNDTPNSMKQSDNSKVKKKTQRSYTPAKSGTGEIQQLDADISHLCNMMITSTNQTAVIDPRSNQFGHVYVDKNKVETFLPTELIRSSVFSRNNSHQFYSFTNIHVRVFDKRYPCSPINTVAHMLEPETFDAMDASLIKYDGYCYETLCLSSFGRLGFITFDQTQHGNLITPKSLHQPVHEPSPSEVTGSVSDELIGLSTSISGVFLGEEVLFSVMQLSKEGDVCIRGYTPSVGCDMEFETQAQMIIKEEKTTKSQSLDDCATIKGKRRRSCRRRRNDGDDGPTYLNPLDASVIVDAEEKISSKRGLERYENMKSKLSRK